MRALEKSMARLCAAVRERALRDKSFEILEEIAHWRLMECQRAAVVSP